MAVQPWRKGIVTRIEDYTHNTKRFWIEVPELTSFDFVPGQFVTFDLPIHEKPNKRLRSYSISSWPDGTNTFELVIVYDGINDVRLNFFRFSQTQVLSNQKRTSEQFIIGVQTN